MGDKIITGGCDGFIKVWNYEDIDQAEGDDDSNFYLTPLETYELPKKDGKPARILNLLKINEEYWLIQDGLGRFFKFSFDQKIKPEIIFESNSGGLADMCHSRVHNSSVTIGEDGYVRLWNYAEKK